MPYKIDYLDKGKLVLIGSEEDPCIIKQKEWDAAHMDAAIRYSKLSHCTRYKVGCIMVIERRPIAIGINGSAPGQDNCDEVFLNPIKAGQEGYEEFKEEHRVWSYENEHHAEANAIDWCARNGIATQGATIYSTLSTCMPCAKTMVMAGIKRFVYLEQYDRESIGLNHLRKNKVIVNQFGQCTLDPPSFYK